MKNFEELLQSADWKSEKHVPVIEIVEKGETVKLNVSVGKEIPHPNKTEHHIRWIEIYFLPEESKFPYMIGKADFTSHGASTEGPDTSTVYTEPTATFSFKTEKSGILYAFSYCNIHGLWVNSEELNL
jgi:superoxide reductase